MYDKFTVAKVRDVCGEMVYTIDAFIGWGDGAFSNHDVVRWLC